MSFFRETLWSTQDGNFIIADQKIVAALIADPVFNPKSKSTVKKSMVRKATPTLSTMFTNNTEITHFEEFEKFPTTIIGTQQFRSCENLYSIVLPKNTTTIKNSAFLGCLKLESFSIPNTVTSIEAYAFAGTNAFTEFTFPSNGSITTISSFLFENSGVQTVNLPSSGVTKIEEGAFNTCSNLRTVNNLNSTSNPITILESRAFYNDWNLEAAGLPSTLETIGSYALYNCQKWEITSLPYSLKEIGQFSFAVCKKLTITEIPNNSELTTIGYAAFTGTGITNITIPSNITTISKEAFKGCSFTGFTLSEGVKSILASAFSGGSYTITDLPASLETLGGEAFNTMTNYYINIKSPSIINIDSATSSTGHYEPFPSNTIICLNTWDLVNEYEADTDHWGKFKTDYGYQYTIQGNITFEDPNMKAACVDRTTPTTDDDTNSPIIIDINNDGEIAYWEALKCSDVGTKFEGNTTIEKFNEFKYFKNITNLVNTAFKGCTKLESIRFPDSLKKIRVTDVFINTALKDFDYGNLDEIYAQLPSTIETVYIHSIIAPTDRHADKLSNLANIYADTLDYWLGMNMSSGYTDDHIIINYRHAADLYIDNVKQTSITIPNTYSVIRRGCFANLNLDSITIPSSITSIKSTAFRKSSEGSGYALTFEDASKITYIGDSAFGNNTTTSGITADLFTNVETIESYAFANCKNINLDIVAPALTKLYMAAFNKTNIKTFTSNLTGLYSGYWDTWGTFGYCTELTTVNIPNVKVIEQNTFYSCTALTECNYSSECTEIQRQAFYNCENLEDSSELSNTIKTIGNHAFDNCKKLTYTKLPDSIESIGPGAFLKASLVNITVLPATVTTLHNSTFYNTASDHLKIKCSEMVTADKGSRPFNFRPMNEGSIFCVATEDLINQYKADTVWAEGIADYNYAFVLDGHISFTDPNVKSVLTATGHADYDGDGEIDYWEAYKCQHFYTSDEDGENVTRWFEGNTSITEFTEFQNFVRFDSIETNTFKECTNLQKITLPPNLVAIGDNAFYYDVKLDTINIDNITTIGVNAFSGCASLNLTSLPSTLTSISHSVFTGTNISITEVPSTITSMGQSVFESCKNIRNITFNANLDTLPACTFKNCTNLLSITLPDSIKSINEQAFSNCSNLTITQLPSALKIIYGYAFYNVKEITCELPDSVTTIGWHTFENVTVAFTKIPSGVTSLDAGIFNNATFTSSSFTLHEGLVTIQESAFKGAKNLNMTSIPSTVTSIGNHAFDNTDVAFTSFPSNIETIGFGAFRDASNVNITSIPAQITTINNNILSGTAVTAITINAESKATAVRGVYDTFTPFPSNTTVYVKTAELKAEYEADADWSNTTANYTFVVA